MVERVTREWVLAQGFPKSIEDFWLRYLDAEPVRGVGL